jgi:large subunit ribosomal protein L19
MKNRLLALVEETGLKKDVAQFRIGDQVEVHQRILEGQKERVQVFSGVVIARKGEGMRESFTVRRIVQGEGVERIFPVNSPKIAKIELKRTGRVRRAKLYYLRERVGKATRLRERTKGGIVEGPTGPAAKAAAKSKEAAAKEAAAAAKASEAGS